MRNTFVLCAHKTSMLTLMLVTLSLVAQKTKYTIEATLNPELKLVQVKQ